jgi:hypothetical protein
MVAKKKRTGAATKKGRVKVGNLKLNRETVKNLSGSGRKQIKGGALGRIEPRYPTLSGTPTC